MIFIKLGSFEFNSSWMVGWGDKPLSFHIIYQWLTILIAKLQIKLHAYSAY